MGRAQVVAQRLHARRVPQVEAVDLEPIAPLVEVGLPAVPEGRVAREPGGDDERCARPQELDAGLVPDLHPPTGEQRDPARGGRPSRCAWRSCAPRTAGTAGRRSGGSRRTSACRRSSAARRSSGAARRPRPGSSGGKTLGVMNTGLSRSRRIPVSVSTSSSRCSRGVLLLPAARLGLAATGLDVGLEGVGGRVEEADAVLRRQRRRGSSDRRRRPPGGRRPPSAGRPGRIRHPPHEPASPAGRATSAGGRVRRDRGPAPAGRGRCPRGRAGRRSPGGRGPGPWPP